MSVFDENYIEVNIINGEESCPICGRVGCLMDIEEETENYKKFKETLVDNIGIPTLVNFDEENDDALVIIVHNIVKELLTDKRCPHCDAPLYCSDLPQYDYVCIECEENFYECEVK
jgi:hypothetical protein